MQRAVAPVRLGLRCTTPCPLACRHALRAPGASAMIMVSSLSRFSLVGETYRRSTWNNIGSVGTISAHIRGAKLSMRTLVTDIDSDEAAVAENVAQQFQGRLPVFVPEAAGALSVDTAEGFWWMQVAQCNRPAAQEMAAKLTVGGNLLGVNTSARGISIAEGSVFLFALNARHQHPRKIILFRQGDFYEVMGFDAVRL